LASALQGLVADFGSGESFSHICFLCALVLDNGKPSAPAVRRLALGLRWCVLPSARASPERLLETAKGLEVTQQQAVDQLQVVQDQLMAQQTETKKLSEQIAMLTEKLDALQQSVANIPAPSVAAPLPTPKAPPSKK
jgi:uncharacterized coiled-coil protein SlyX